MTGMNPLLHHPDTPCPAVGHIEAGVKRNLDGSLDLIYRLTGDTAALRIPEPALRRHRDGLWKNTCFEVFAMPDCGPGYLEFNFSTSGEWAAYTFRAYRDGTTLELYSPPDIVCETTPNGLHLTATVPAGLLPESGLLRIGLSAVIEDTDGRIAYWALKHAPGKPDFHHTDAFALEFSHP